MNNKKGRATRKRCVRKCKKRTSRKLRGSRHYGGGRTPASESERSRNSVRSTISKRRPDSATPDWIKNLEREQVLRRVAEEERKEREKKGPHWGYWTPNYSWETKPPTTSDDPYGYKWAARADAGSAAGSSSDAATGNDKTPSK